MQQKREDDLNSVNSPEGELHIPKSELHIPHLSKPRTTPSSVYSCYLNTQICR